MNFNNNNNNPTLGALLYHILMIIILVGVLGLFGYSGYYDYTKFEDPVYDYIILALLVMIFKSLYQVIINFPSIKNCSAGDIWKALIHKNNPGPGISSRYGIDQVSLFSKVVVVFFILWLTTVIGLYFFLKVIPLLKSGFFLF